MFYINQVCITGIFMSFSITFVSFTTGIAVRTDNSSFYMHHKFVIIDNTRLLNGSFNWTRQAVTGNQENLLVTSDSQLVCLYKERFAKLWRQYKTKKDQWYCVKPCCMYPEQSVIQLLRQLFPMKNRNTIQSWMCINFIVTMAIQVVSSIYIWKDTLDWYHYLMSGTSLLHVLETKYCSPDGEVFVCYFKRKKILSHVIIKEITMRCQLFLISLFKANISK